MNKLIIIINGSGGVGKDTLCDIVEKYYSTMNVSSIDPIKEIASKNGWNGEKDPKSRKFLADLKQLFVDYNDLPQKYLFERVNEFLANDKQILFVHIREPEEIHKFKEKIDFPCITLLVRGRETATGSWNNTSDDDVENYNYNFYYENSKSLEHMESDFMEFFVRILKTQE